MCGENAIKMKTIPVTTDIQKQIVEAQASETWDGLRIVVHRELFDLRELPCLIAVFGNCEVFGYCYYRFSNETEIEIMTIEAMRKNSGVGSLLIGAIVELAKSSGCHRLYLQTTNDNTNAMRFYQRQGFSMCELRLNELDYSRKLKPSIPLVGDDDIPLMHEIEFEMILKEHQTPIEAMYAVF